MQSESSFNRVFLQPELSGVAELPPTPLVGEAAEAAKANGDEREVKEGGVYLVGRLACFFGMLTVLVFGLNAVITSGLRQVKTSQFGVSNKIMQGEVNAQIVVTGSSRALSHYDPRFIQAYTGRSAFNLGRNGSQTDMQIAVLRAYLEHNRKPEIVIHNLDGFAFVTTREVYDPAQYVPYLYDKRLIVPCGKLTRTYGEAVTCLYTVTWSTT